jgi:hypothetical protein
MELKYMILNKIVLDISVFCINLIKGKIIDKKFI